MSICIVPKKTTTTKTAHSFTGNQRCVKRETTLNFSHFFGNLNPELHILSHPGVSDVSDPTRRAPALACVVQRANNSAQDVKSLPVVGWDAHRVFKTEVALGEEVATNQNTKSCTPPNVS